MACIEAKGAGGTQLVLWSPRPDHFWQLTNEYPWKHRQLSCIRLTRREMGIAHQCFESIYKLTDGSMRQQVRKAYFMEMPSAILGVWSVDRLYRSFRIWLEQRHWSSEAALRPWISEDDMEDGIPIGLRLLLVKLLPKSVILPTDQLGTLGASACAEISSVLARRHTWQPRDHVPFPACYRRNARSHFNHIWRIWRKKIQEPDMLWHVSDECVSAEIMIDILQTNTRISFNDDIRSKPPYDARTERANRIDRYRPRARARLLPVLEAALSFWLPGTIIRTVILGYSLGSSESCFDSGAPEFDPGAPELERRRLYSFKLTDPFWGTKVVTANPGGPPYAMEPAIRDRLYVANYTLAGI